MFKLRTRLLSLLFLISVVIICALCLWYKSIFPHKYQLGERSYYNYVTHSDYKIVDEVATSKKLKQAKSQILKYFLAKPPLVRTPIDEKSIKHNLDNTFKDLEIYYLGNPAHLEERDTYLTPYLPYFEVYGIEDIYRVQPIVHSISNVLLKVGYIGNIDIKQLEYLLAEHLQYYCSERTLVLIQTIIKASLEPNLKINLDKLEAFEKKTLSKVQPIYKNIPAQTTILNKGEIITFEKYDILKQLNEDTSTNFHFGYLQEALGFTFLSFICFLFYLRLEKVKIDNPHMILLSILIVLASVLSGCFAYNKPAFFPLAAIAMTVSLFFRASIGFAASLIFSLLIFLSLKTNFIDIIPAFIAMFVGSFIALKSENRGDLTKYGLWLIIVQPLVYLLSILIRPEESLSLVYLLEHAIAGLLTVILVVFNLPIIEQIFGIVNRFRLRELSDLEQPLLRELKEKAPGTFEHTLMVADLATNAAQELQLNHALVRVGVLYHDIGKTHQPNIFIENQFDGYNPHTQLSHLESSQAIIKHVTFGLEKAKKAGLPELIYRFIPMHHGTAFAGNFYHKAVEEQLEDLNEADFRYPGPPPCDKETGIVMLADTVEATVRSEKTDNHFKIREIIFKMVDIRAQDGQLAFTGLTDQDLDIIKMSFFETWKNKNHERVKY